MNLFIIRSVAGIATLMASVNFSQNSSLYCEMMMRHHEEPILFHLTCT